MTDVLIAVLSLSLGALIGKYLLSARSSKQSADQVAASAKLEQELETTKLAACKAEDALKQCFQDLTLSNGQMARLEEREKNLLAMLESKNVELKSTQQKLQVEFENIANRILDQTSQKLADTSQKKLGDLLTPLKEKIDTFQKKVEDCYLGEGREFASLKAEIAHIMEANRGLNEQATNLSNALKNDPQMRGRWGELVLERILSASGLNEGHEYITQGKGLSLKDENGRAVKPDVLIKLPQNRHFVIDSKVPLVGFDAYIACQVEEERAVLAKGFMASVKRHIDDLGSKQYQDNDQIIAHDLVLMFLPIEGALAAACNFDGDLFEYGWQRRVVVVGPSTLMMTLRTVESIWRYERQAEDAKRISKIAAGLYDKFAGSIECFRDVTTQLRKASQSHDTAIDRLLTGRGNALSLAEKLKSNGVKPRKNLSVLGIVEQDNEIDDLLDATSDETIDQAIES